MSTTDPKFKPPMRLRKTREKMPDGRLRELRKKKTRQALKERLRKLET